jgi:hypothetical protein
MGDCTPYEAWNGRKPHLGHLKVFGCTANVRSARPHLRKLADMSQRMMYLGVEEGSKAHRLYDAQNNKIAVSRDVVFEENVKFEWGTQNVTDCNVEFQVLDENLSEQLVDGTGNVPNGDLLNEGMPGAAGDADIHSQGSTSSGGGVPDMLQSPSTQTMPLGSYSPLVNTIGNQAMGETLEQSPSAVEQPQFGFDNSGASSSDSEDQPERLRSLNDIYQNTSEVELMYDSDGEALMVEMEEPTSYKEASSYAEWTEAMNKEIQSIEKNKTWKLCQLPVGHKPIGLKWVYKLKKNSDGVVTKHKARLVAKGYVQKKGIDFDEVFAPVARLDTVRLFLAMAANRGWQVHHLDVKSAFLHGELEEEVYVSQPEGYVVEGKEQYVLKLSKALYGLRQAPRAWNVRLDRSLKKLKFRRCASEQAVYTRGVGKNAIILGVYVDDLIITGEDPVEIKEFKEQMTKEFEMSDLGLLSYYLGIEVGQYTDFTIVKQTGYAKKVLDQFGMG